MANLLCIGYRPSLRATASLCTCHAEQAAKMRSFPIFGPRQTGNNLPD